MSSSSLLLCSLELSDAQVHEPQIQALLGTTPHSCEVVVVKLRKDAYRGASSGGLEKGSSSLLLSSLELSDTTVYAP